MIDILLQEGESNNAEVHFNVIMTTLKTPPVHCMAHLPPSYHPVEVPHVQSKANPPPEYHMLQKIEEDELPSYRQAIDNHERIFNIV